MLAPDTGVRWLPSGIIHGLSTAAGQESSSSADSRAMLSEEGIGCGIRFRAGGFQENCSIRSTIPEESLTGLRTKGTDTV